MQKLLNSFLIESEIVWTKSYVTAVVLALGYTVIKQLNIFLMQVDHLTRQNIKCLHHIQLCCIIMWVMDIQYLSANFWLYTTVCCATGFGDAWWRDSKSSIGSIQILHNSLMKPQLYVCSQSIALLWTKARMFWK